MLFIGPGLANIAILTVLILKMASILVNVFIDNVNNVMTVLVLKEIKGFRTNASCNARLRDRCVCGT